MSSGDTRPRRSSGQRSPWIWALALLWWGASCGGPPADTAGASSGAASSAGVGGSTAMASSSASSGAGGAHGGGGAGGSGGPAICPPGSDTLKLSLAGANPTPVAGVPPADSYGQGFSILEGPVWIDGALYMSQITAAKQPPPSRILKLVPGMSPQVFLDDAGTNGLAVDKAGQLFGAVHKDGSISRFDLANPMAAPVVIASKYMGARFNSPNDLAIRSDGNIYFSDPSYQAPNPNPQAAQRAYRVKPNGDVEIIGTYTENGMPMVVQTPNGVMLSRDEDSLYIGGSGGLFKFSLAQDGSLTMGARVLAVNGGVDGVTKDCAGNTYVVMVNDQGFVVLDKNDALIGSVKVGVQATNVAFGGQDRKTLYITSLGGVPKLFELPLNVPGYPY